MRQQCDFDKQAVAGSNSSTSPAALRPSSKLGRCQRRRGGKKQRTPQQLSVPRRDAEPSNRANSSHCLGLNIVMIIIYGSPKAKRRSKPLKAQADQTALSRS